MGFPIPELPTHKQILLGFRFGVFFFGGGVVPNPIDIRFKKVRGLAAEVKTTTLPEGGQNLYTQRLPTGVDYGNLILERGMVIGSPLTLDFNTAMSLFEFAPANVLVTLFNEESIPVSAWMFIRAYPVKWATSDLDASEKAIVIDTLELAYSRMQIVRI